VKEQGFRRRLACRWVAAARPGALGPRRSALIVASGLPRAIGGHLPSIAADSKHGSDSQAPSPETHRRANISMERTGDSGLPLKRSIGATLALAERTWRAKNLHTASPLEPASGARSHVSGFKSSVSLALLDRGLSFR
jgi:hypothetical protein